MKVTTHTSVPVYTISGTSTGRPLPEWLLRKRRRSLKQDPEYANRIELLQDFEFEEASQCIRISEDGQWAMSTGTYKPQIHTHNLPNLALSFARHTSSLNTTFRLLSSDYSKSIHLQADRSIELHTPNGCHYTIRIPRYGRDLLYNQRAAEALVPAVGVNADGLGDVFRLNLELGRFLRSFEVNILSPDEQVQPNGTSAISRTASINVGAAAVETHNLLAFGTSLGTIEFWDPRSRDRVGLLQAPWTGEIVEGGQEVTALELHQSGLGLAAGSSGGLVHLYDLRTPRPLLKKDQGFGFPIQDLIYLDQGASRLGSDSENKVLSADKRIIKIWDGRTGAPWTSVEPSVDLHSVAWCRDSGMFLTANEGRQQHAFFVPQLGSAPPWCSFLDNLVEEMAEDPNDPNAYAGQQAGEVYDNYKFLTPAQLESLNLSHLIGTTNLLRPYMHGFFVAQKLYEEARIIADPFTWEQERMKRVRAKIDTERESRIRGHRKVNTKVNAKLAEKILLREEKVQDRRARLARENEGASQDGADNATQNGAARRNPLNDARFARLFEDEEYAIDETSREFKALNPSSVPTIPSNGDKLTAVEHEMADAAAAKTSSDSDGDTASEETSTPPQRTVNMQTKTRAQTVNSKSSDRLQMRVSSSSKPTTSRTEKSFGTRRDHDSVRSRPLKGRSVVGEREMTFEPTKRSKGPALPSQPMARDQRKARRSASGNVMRRL